MDEQELFRLSLQRKLVEIKQTNPMYSMRAFARRLNMAPAALSEILRGKRRVSKKKALATTTKLGLNSKDLAQIEKLFEKNKTKTTASEDLKFNREVISLEHFDLISEWHHFALLSLSECEGFNSDPQWVAERLNISVTKAKKSLEKLEKLGYLKRNSNGQLLHAEKAVVTDDDRGDLAIKKRHESCLQSAIESLYTDQVSERDFTAMTLAMSPSKIPIAKKMIRKFLNELTETLESGPRQEVYEVCIQLFPRTKPREVSK